MVGKCNSPTCSTLFRYPKDRELFRLDIHAAFRSYPSVRPEYFWLWSRMLGTSQPTWGRPHFQQAARRSRESCGEADENLWACSREGVALDAE
jgi:hypothetical protein